MRSAAALASAFEDVAQVRYSRSGSFGVAAREPGFGTDLQLRQRHGDILDRLERVQRAGAGNSGPHRYRGVIGASMFSPRPARGYRFHSLQVEIIAASSQLRKLQPFSSNHSVRGQHFRWNLNVLLQKISAGNHYGINLSFMPIAVTAIAVHPPRIVAECCSFVSLLADPAHAISPSRDRDIGGKAPRALAGSAPPGGRSRHSIKTNGR